MWLGRELGQPEVENLGLATQGDEDIAGLDISVNDSFRVRSVQRVRNLNGQVKQRVPLD